MYHINSEKQVTRNKENSNLLLNSLCKNPSSQPLNKLPVLTPSTKRVLQFLFRFKNAPARKMSNSYIASEIGCSTKTVQRATNTLCSLGLISKHQSFMYMCNVYSINLHMISKSTEFSMWFNSLSLDGQYEFQNRNVMHDESLFEEQDYVLEDPFSCPSEYVRRKNIIYNNPGDGVGVYTGDVYSHPDTNTRAPAYAHEEYAQYGHRSTELLIKLFQPEKGRKKQMLDEKKRKDIMARAKHPRAKDALMNPAIMSLIITPNIKKLAEVMELDERERLKLIAFPDASIEYLLGMVNRFCSNPDSMTMPVINKMGWIFKKLVDLTKENKLEVQWKWYFTVAEILGIPKITDSEEIKPWTPTPKAGAFDKIKEMLEGNEDSYSQSTAGFKIPKYLKDPKTGTTKTYGAQKANQSKPSINPYMCTSSSPEIQEAHRARVDKENEAYKKAMAANKAYNEKKQEEFYGFKQSLKETPPIVRTPPVVMKDTYDSRFEYLNDKIKWTEREIENWRKLIAYSDADVANVFKDATSVFIINRDNELANLEQLKKERAACPQAYEQKPIPSKEPQYLGKEPGYLEANSMIRKQERRFISGLA